MKLVVGLGNPGRKYEGTRHNVGFEVVAELARRHGSPAAKEAFFGQLSDVRIGSERVLLLCPETFMNLSGKSVLAGRDFYKLTDDAVLIVTDDFNLPLGKLRIRTGGSPGGHNGLEDVIRVLGSDAVPRLRIGVGEPPASMAAHDYVLGRFAAAERPEIDLAIARAADAVETWATSGIAVCMNQFN
jgi:PTH1 family peptidyl-tRNA hydrolase